MAAAQLVEAGARVVVFDNLSMGHRGAIHPRAIFVQGDLADAAQIDAVIAAPRPEAVLHFAARTLVGESMQEPLRYLGGNVRGSLNLLESMLRHNVRRIIFSSTANLFSKPQTNPICEMEALVPGSPYGESKLIVERMLYWLGVTQGLRYAVLRYFNAAGATETLGEDHTPETHLIPLVLEVALGKRKSVTIFGDDYPTRDGTCIRDYIHVADLARAHILALGVLDDPPAAGAPGRIYHLGNGQGFSVREVIETARALTGHAIPAEVGPRRPGDPPELVADSSKIRRELGWVPQFPRLRDIIAGAWNWHQLHPNGYAE